MYSRFKLDEPRMIEGDDDYNMLMAQANRRVHEALSERHLNDPKQIGISII